jgi:hypothetical protein
VSRDELRRRIVAAVEIEGAAESRADLILGLVDQVTSSACKCGAWAGYGQELVHAQDCPAAHLNRWIDIDPLTVAPTYKDGRLVEVRRLAKESR